MKALDNKKMASLDLIKQHAWKPILAALFIWLQYQLWFDETGVLSNIHLKDQIQEQAEVNLAIEARNQVLTEEILAIKSGQGSLEAKARKELGMIKEDETYFIVLPPKENEQDSL